MKTWLEGLSSEEREALRRTGQALADLAAADAPGDRKPGEDLRERQDKLLDEAVEETFPASDPIAPTRITR
ncbi:hypothetical protein HJG44_08225 [Enterovirga sp. DB1703]|uniref:Uncharacterized protein n=1 Tax=Enterovirga aerilata TaxID=2730920 RepID=A0A849I4T7_9HYPH|nr:hypothetical protein [Enterovirga sp. DB1703]